jgi:hypothetical protein
MMRTGFVAITLALGIAGLMLAGPPRAHAACEGCDEAASGNHAGSVKKRTIHRLYRTKLYPALPAYGVELPGCYWRKMRLWDPDGQYFLVSRIQFCR